MRRIILPFLLALFFVSSTISAQETQTPKAKPKIEYVGSAKSKKFHKTTCLWAKKISARNKVTFASKKEAEDAGYKACKICEP